jgi:hypothetical protein
MNIHAKPGAKVVFSNPKAGYPSDQKLAKEHLEVGKTYTVSVTDVDQSRTNVYLKEFPEIAFNSVLFSDAPKKRSKK